MHVWFYPVAAPDVYVVLRPDPETTIVCISDGMPMQQAAAAACQMCTEEERDWVRVRVGSKTVAEDPSYNHIDRLSKGQPLWHHSMLPDYMIWRGESPCTEDRGGAAGMAMVWAGVAAAVVGVVTSAINGESGLFTPLPFA